MNFLRNSKGFTLLVSSLIGSLMLVVGLAIFNITFKEAQLTSTSRDSQLAFYAADAGMECALFWDFQHPTFPNTVFATSSSYTGVSSGSFVTCGVADISIAWNIPVPPITSANAATTTFDLVLGESCAKITVMKYFKSTNSSKIPNTKVESRGQTLCGTGSSRRVERALRITY